MGGMIHVDHKMTPVHRDESKQSSLALQGCPIFCLLGSRANQLGGPMTSDLSARCGASILCHAKHLSKGKRESELLSTHRARMPASPTMSQQRACNST